ncbi:hypothetical protein CAPTEDRAFT_223850 [Capitella teleta]|uniref:Uncharacterized protein n=1 Tax=Capitella teleta TaxID=283909 RepID=R7T9L7_CAPTE|nr:hypothetical protein CAPTEDRAFT_223850 [Capitella teleta]|eukprot:ELT87664.1 hypothetical protein CAPTEDRAFT_223850 [Capitella teleta]
MSSNERPCMFIEFPTTIYIVVPWPNTYRGLFREDHANLGEAYALEVKKKIQAVHKEGRQIAGFICEPLMSTAGVITPPQNYLKHVYKLVREAGGVCIADEVQVGLGRVGDYYWSFQSYDVVPDIVTCGKPMGNGFPMAAVVTTTEVANSLACFESSFGGNPVSCSVGLAVLDVIQNEKLLSSAKCVGLVLLEGFRNIQPNHPMMGDVRGQGLIIGVELVTDKESRKPASEAAELLTYKAKQLRILVANEGPDKNVIVMTPPLCFNIDNARHVIQVIDKVLAEIERGTCPDQMSAQSDEGITELTIPLDIVSGVESYDDDDDDPHCKRARYEDMD